MRDQKNRVLAEICNSPIFCILSLVSSVVFLYNSIVFGRKVVASLIFEYELSISDYMYIVGTIVMVAMIIFLFVTLQKYKYSGEIYENQASALNNIKHDFYDSNSVYVLAIRGKDFCEVNGAYNFFWDDLEKKIEIVTASPDNEFAVKSRGSTAYYKKNHQYLADLNMVKEIMTHKLKNYVNCSYYNHLIDLSFRLVIFDKFMYVSFFNEGIRADESVVRRFNRDSQSYKAFMRYYLSIKDNSTKIEFESEMDLKVET
ncbi:MAG: hypothetical protein R3Y65_05200 [Bacillota bacterium]